MSDVEYITTINQNKRRIREVADDYRKEQTKHRNLGPVLFYGLMGSALTTAPMLFALGRYIAGFFVLACAALFWSVGTATRED